MGMRRLFIIRKDLHLSAGKLGAMVAHCAEGYWIWLIRKNLTEENGRVHASFDLDREIYDDYLNGRITKTICEAKNLNKLLQARDMALELGLVENQDFGMINDACLTELTPDGWTKMAKAAALLESGSNLFRMMLPIASVKSISFIRINCFGLFVNQFADYSKIIDSIFYTELINGIYGIYW